MTYLLRSPVFRRYAGARVLAGMPTAMRPLVLVLIGHHLWHSFAAAGCLAAASGVVGAVAAPRIGRHLDAVTLPRGLTALVWGGCGAFVAVAVGALTGNGILVVVGSLGAGLSSAGSGAGMRDLLLGLFPEHADDTFTADALLIELMWVLGPALAGAAALISPAVAALSGAVCLAAAALIGRRLPPRPGRTRGAGSTARERSIFSYPPFLVALALDIGLGGHVGALDAALPSAMVQFRHPPAFAGITLGLIALASAAGGILSLRGTVRATLHKLPAGLRGAVLVVVFGLLLLPAAAAPTPATLTLDLVIAGTLLAIINGAAATACGDALPDRQAEGFAVMGAASALAAGAGSALAGLVADHSSQVPGLLLAAGIPLAAGLIACIVMRVAPRTPTPSHRPAERAALRVPRKRRPTVPGVDDPYR